MKFKSHLNDKIWQIDNNNEIRPEVKDKLNEIADAFIEFIDIPDEAILDMVITGSSASYNYNEHSDLDLHIIVDYDKIHEDCPLVEGYLGALKNTFNKEHDIFIHGVPVELYAEKKDQGTVHNGLYSLKDEKWIDIPRKIPPTTNDAAVEAKYQEIKDMVDKCDDSEAANELLEKIYKMRKAGLSEVGEFSTENLAFKKLRNDGCMDKLRQLKKEKIDKQLSLESYNESEDKLDYKQFKIEKDNFGVYGVTPYDSRIGRIEGTSATTVANKLAAAINKYNSKSITAERKALINKLHKLFKQAGIPKRKDMTTSIRGYRPITQSGYYIEILKGDYTTFSIVITGNRDEYGNKIKEILNSAGIKYTGSVDYFTVDMEKQDIKNESIKEGIKEQVSNNRTHVNEEYINVSSGLYIKPCEPELEEEFKEAVKQCKSLYEFERKFHELAQDCEICAEINDHEYCSFDLEDLCDNIEYGFENSYVETNIDEWIVEEDKVYVGYLTLEAGDDDYEDFDENLNEEYSSKFQTELQNAVDSEIKFDKEFHELSDEGFDNMIVKYYGTMDNYIKCTLDKKFHTFSKELKNEVLKRVRNKTEKVKTDNLYYYQKRFQDFTKQVLLDMYNSVDESLNEEDKPKRYKMHISDVVSYLVGDYVDISDYYLNEDKFTIVYSEDGETEEKYTITTKDLEKELGVKNLVWKSDEEGLDRIVYEKEDISESIKKLNIQLKKLLGE